jgi:type II secretory pathway component GspD/PulD (secretin)
MTNKSLSFNLLHNALTRIIITGAIFSICFTQLQAKNVSAQDLNTRISLQVVNMPVKDVLKQINKETNISFVFSNTIVNNQDAEPLRHGLLRFRRRYPYR